MKTATSAVTGWLFAISILSGCNPAPESVQPQPVAMTEEALGHFCQMVVLDHPGPKAQIHLAGQPAPLFFSQVRDGIAYYKSAERDFEITAFYVSDMGRAKNWDEPGIGNWFDAESAHFVVGSNARGGMGAPELVPFSSETAAKGFADEKGGQLLMLADIPESAVLGSVEISTIQEQPGS